MPSSTPPPVRMALAGYGYIGRVHAKSVGACTDAVLTAVYGPDRAKADAFAADFRAPADAAGFAFAVHTDWAALAADPNVDAVIVALPNSLHAPVSLACLAAGKHVLVEKPMAMNTAEGESMRDAARAHGVRLMVAHQWRWDREAQWLRGRLDAGTVGRVVKTKGYGIHANWGPSGWFVDPELAGGGALVDMGVHAVDTVRYLLGDPAPVEVYAKLGTAYGDYAVDDWGVLMITWSSGTVSVVESGWWNPHMDGPEASTQIVGTTGYANLFPTDAGPVVDGTWAPEGATFPARSEHCDPHAYDAQVAGFVASIRAGVDVEATADDGLAVMRITDAAYRSAREGVAVRISHAQQA